SFRVDWIDSLKIILRTPRRQNFVSEASMIYSDFSSIAGVLFVGKSLSLSRLRESFSLNLEEPENLVEQCHPIALSPCQTMRSQGEPIDYPRGSSLSASFTVPSTTLRE
ncbi:MAG: hypothetical protein NT070_17855, partial [Cyanobacteria bacterium]|nr:hypothetical protein [Cyanobacteriota bacterium]